MRFLRSQTPSRSKTSLLTIASRVGLAFLVVFSGGCAVSKPRDLAGETLTREDIDRRVSVWDHDDNRTHGRLAAYDSEKVILRTGQDEHAIAWDEIDRLEVEEPMGAGRKFLTVLILIYAAVGFAIAAIYNTPHT